MKQPQKQRIPSYIASFLWSYDVAKLDLKKDKKRIVTNVLNLGTKKASQWVLNTYSKREIQAVLRQPLPGEWNDKSLNVWSWLFNITPQRTKRRL